MDRCLFAERSSLNSSLLFIEESGIITELLRFGMNSWPSLIPNGSRLLREGRRLRIFPLDLIQCRKSMEDKRRPGVF